MPRKKYRAGAIGHTGQGNYGHHLHLSYQGLKDFDFVAVADPDETGRLKAKKDTSAARSYADYAEMLAVENLDFVSVCLRWVTQHEDMLKACIQAGCHVYCEKPMTGDLASADRVITAACEAGVKIAVAHQGVYLPQIHAVKQMVQEGKIGKLLSMEAVGKQDRRGGGEDTLVLGTHLFNMMRFFAGDPKFVEAYVGQDGRPATLLDAREAREPIGLVAGDHVNATYLFGNEVVGRYCSRKDQPGEGQGYGLVLVGEEGRLAIGGNGNAVSFITSPSWCPWNGGHGWEPLKTEWASLHEDGNRLAVLDLVDSVESNRKPISDATDARWALEMIHGIYVSHLGQKRIELPLIERMHPLVS